MNLMVRCSHKRIHSHTHTHIHTHAYTREVYEEDDIYNGEYEDEFNGTVMHSHSHKRIRTHTYIHTHTHALAHTHTRALTYLLLEGENGEEIYNDFIVVNNGRTNHMR